MHLEITDLRTLTDDTPHVRELEFTDVPVSIGSHSANAVQLPDLDVAPYHAMILPTVENHWLFQPGSAEGVTQLNGKRVSGQVELEDGDVFKISHFEIKIVLDSDLELELPESRNLDEIAKIRQYPLPRRSEIRPRNEDVTILAAQQTSLADFAVRLRSCAALSDLLESTLDILIRELNARTVWIGVRRGPSGPLEFMDSRSDDGGYSGEPDMLETFVYRCLSREQFITIPRTGKPNTQSVLAAPMLVGQSALGLIIADTHKHKKVFKKADMDFLTFVAALVGPTLRSINEDQAGQKTALASSELALLHEVQARMEPSSVPQWPQLQIAAFAKPGLERSGDVYDVMRLPNGLASFIMGTVRGDTLRTALAAAEVRAAFRIAALHADPPHVQLKALNWLLDTADSTLTFDTIILVTNPKTGAAEYCTAGRIGAIIVDAKGAVRTLTTSSAPAIGVNRSFNYTPTKERLHDLETLAMFSDGCATVRDANQTPLGAKRFMNAVADGFGQPPSAVLDDLLADLAPFLKDGVPLDDITVLLIHRAITPP